MSKLMKSLTMGVAAAAIFVASTSAYAFCPRGGYYKTGYNGYYHGGYNKYYKGHKKYYKKYYKKYHNGYTKYDTDKPSEGPSDERANAPSDERANAPANTPSDERANTPSDERANAPSDERANAPSDERANAPADEPVNENENVDGNDDETVVEAPGRTFPSTLFEITDKVDCDEDGCEGIVLRDADGNQINVTDIEYDENLVGQVSEEELNYQLSQNGHAVRGRLTESRDEEGDLSYSFVIERIYS